VFSQRRRTMTSQLRRPPACCSLGMRALITVLTALCLAAVLWPAAASAQAIPPGGDFETVPTTWMSTGSAGLLSTIGTVQTGDAGNHYLRTTYHALVGIGLVGLDAHATITSPAFSWSQATPQALTFTMDERASLGTLVGIDSGVTVSASLDNLTTHVVTPLESNAITQDSTTFQTFSATAARTLLVNGDSYQLVVTESVDPLVAVLGQATIDLDNVALDVTPAAPPAPVLTTGSATITQITSSSAQANATVDPGSSASTVSVDYGTTTAYGAEVDQQLAANSGPTPVTLPITGLAPSTTYHAEVVATSAAGTVTSGDLTFTTSAQPTGASPPAVSNSTVEGSPGERTATLGATIDTGGLGVTYSVQYGTTAAYGSTTSSQTLAAGTTGGQPVIVDLSALTPGTTYHAQIVATGPGGTTDGPDITFTTGPLTPPTATIPTFAPADMAGTAVSVATTVDPGNDDTQVSVSYGKTTGYGTTTPTQTVTAGSGLTGVQFAITGLTAGTTYHFQVTATSLDGTVTTTDIPDTPMPTSTPPVGATSLGALGQTTATLNSSINPNGASASYDLAYGTDPASLSSMTTMQPVAGATPQTLSAMLSGLTPGTTYTAQFVVSFSGGTSAGQEFTFTTKPATPPTLTPPTIDSSSITDIAPTSASLTATVDPGDSATTVDADYGPTPGYGSQTTPVTIPAGAGPTPLTITLAGLSPDTTYHVQLVASNSGQQTVFGDDMTFTTGSDAPTAPGSSPGSAPATGSGVGSGTTTASTAATSATTTGTTVSSQATVCVAAYVSASARTLHWLRLPAAAQVTAGHGLTVALAHRSALHGTVRYRINTGAVKRIGRRLTLGLAQLPIGHTTRLTVMLPKAAHRAATRLGLSIAVLPCGAQIRARRLSGSRIAVTVRSALAVRRLTLHTPAHWGAPRTLRLLGTRGLRSLVITGSGRTLRVLHGGRLRVTRRGATVTVSGLSAATTTGVELVFRTRHAHGVLSARVLVARGPAQHTQTVIPTTR
jgi:hypothetical protein